MTISYALAFALFLFKSKSLIESLVGEVKG
jgi:hypothetical protein